MVYITLCMLSVMKCNYEHYTCGNESKIKFRYLNAAPPFVDAHYQEENVG